MGRVSGEAEGSARLSWRALSLVSVWGQPGRPSRSLEAPPLVSQRSWSREGGGLRTRASLHCGRRGGEAELLRAAVQGPDGRPGWAPWCCECWPPRLGGVSCAWPRLSPARLLALPARKYWGGGQYRAEFRAVGSITAGETARAW